MLGLGRRFPAGQPRSDRDGAGAWPDRSGAGILGDGLGRPQIAPAGSAAPPGFAGGGTLPLRGNAKQPRVGLRARSAACRPLHRLRRSPSPASGGGQRRGAERQSQRGEDRRPLGGIPRLPAQARRLSPDAQGADGAAARHPPADPAARRLRSRHAHALLRAHAAQLTRRGAASDRARRARHSARQSARSWRDRRRP